MEKEWSFEPKDVAGDHQLRRNGELLYIIIGQTSEKSMSSSIAGVRKHVHNGPRDGVRLAVGFGIGELAETSVSDVHSHREEAH